jgi:DNA-binding NarL/FixJ family response regulator/signal transduction histidine kinase
VVSWAGGVAFTAVPLAFLFGLLRQRLGQSAVGELVVELGATPAGPELQGALRRALRDPSLEVAYWLPDSGSYVDATGRPFVLPPEGARVATTTVEHGGQRVAALVHDPSLRDDPDLVRAVGAAAGLALSNARLQAELRARLEELRESRSRIVAAGDAERRRLERNLHDGAQQRLLSVALGLRLAQARLAAHPEEAALLARSRQELEQSLQELRELAHGLHPAVLSDHGLAVALEAVAARSPVPVKLFVDLDGRLPDRVEAAAYFLVAEALANVAKHARASKATVQVACQAGWVLVEVRDDGVGNADPSGQGGAARAGRPHRRLGRPPGGPQPPRCWYHGPGRDPMRLVVADDSLLLREGISRLLAEAGFAVVGLAATAEQALERVAEHRPDVAIVDIRMPPTHTDEGLQAARAIRARYPEVGVLVLSQYVELGLAAENAAGLGYLLKDRVTDLEEFAAAIRRVGGGGSALDPAIVSQLLGRRREDDRLQRLTAREHQVLALMAEGYSNQAIADWLVITVRAVEKHVTSILDKLGIPATGATHRRVLAVLAFLRS